MSTQRPATQHSRREPLNPIGRAARGFLGIFWSGFNVILNTAGLFLAVALILSLIAGYMLFIAPVTQDSQGIAETLLVTALLSILMSLGCMFSG